MLNAFRQSWEQVAIELSAESPMFKEAWEDLSRFRSEYSLWQTYGFLPRPKPPRE
jgi:TRAP-type mannitol/chloroaromatic compound transport system substrate-binding protein